MWYLSKNIDESIIMNAMRRGWWKMGGRIFRHCRLKVRRSADPVSPVAGAQHGIPVPGENDYGSAMGLWVEPRSTKLH